jgi:Tfp pilus assembly protein PilO
MSRFGRADRLWMVGGVLVAALLLAVSWFFLISPEHAQRDSLNNEAASTEARMTQLQKRLGDLRKENDKLAEYKALLAKDRRALPTMPALSDLLRELQTAGDLTGVSVSGLNVGNITPLTTSAGPVYTLALSLNVTGTIDKLNALLDQLQQVQPRALLINTASLSRTSATTDSASLALTLNAFVAPSAATPVSPSATASASPPTAVSPSPVPSR